MKRIMPLFILSLFVLLVTFVLFQLRRQQPEIFLSPLTTIQQAFEPKRTHDLTVYGYLPYWTSSAAQLPRALTHISFFSIPIHADGHLLPDGVPLEPGEKQVKKGVLTDLKQQAPHAAIELTLTMMDQDAIERFLATPAATPTFLADLDTFLSAYPVTGINLDVEYIRSVNPEKQNQFTTFFRATSTHIKQLHPNLHLSVAVLADAAEKPRLTDIKSIASYADHIIIMAYDFHRKSSQQSGANAPLYGGEEEKWGTNVMRSAKAYTMLVPAEKLILGVPFYGYEWSVTETNAYNFTLPQSGKTATYERIKTLLDSGKAKRVFDPTSYTPYVLYTQNGKQQQIYYEDAQSLTYKLELVKQAGFGGIAIWALGYEGQSQELWHAIETAKTNE